MAKHDLTAKRLRELLVYNEETGVFTWRIGRPRARAGAIAGGFGCEGYWRISVDWRQQLAHRLAWLYVNGSWPEGDIDHRDGCRTNNAISNLRDVPRFVNLQNQRKARSDNKSGFLGVHAHQGRWRAKIRVNGKNCDLGCHDTPELAHEAYLAAKRVYHAGCTI